jgi:hypothetical protein
MGPVYILAAALVVAFLAFLGIKLARMISKEGFQTMKNIDDLSAFGDDALISKICPNNGVFIGRVFFPSTTDIKKAEELIKPLLDKLPFDEKKAEEILKTLNVKISWLCYSSGISNVDSVFNTDPKTSPSGLMILAPKGSTVKFYSNKDAKGSLVFTFDTSNSVKPVSSLECSSDAICSDPNSKEFYNLQFSSVNITVPTNNSGRPNHYISFGSSPSPASCPTLSPAAAAAVAAVEAKEKENELKAAAIADATSKAISKSVMSSISDPDFGSATGSSLTSDSDGNMVSLSCPSGDKPKITFVRNTRNAIPSSVDTNTLGGVRAANRSSSYSFPDSSPAEAIGYGRDKKCSDSSDSCSTGAIGYGTGGGYNFNPEKDC